MTRRAPPSFSPASSRRLSGRAFACLAWVLASAGTGALAQEALPGETAPPEPAQPRPPATAPAAPAVPALQRVEIRGERSSTQERRRSTAAKTIVGREEIERQGDDNVADVLKRMPGVTVDGAGGRGGEIRMRGMGGGYTQILINGDRMPPGFSLDALSPDQVERVEILRAPSAEFGAQAIAGTINIVLREDVRRKLDTLRGTLGLTRGRLQPGLSWERADADGPMSYSLSANAARQSVFDESRTTTVTSDAGNVTTKDETDHGRTRRERVNAGGRVQWRLAPGETFSLAPYLLYSQSRNAGDSVVAPPVAAGAYTNTERHNSSYFALARTTAQWQAPLSVGGRLEAKVTGNLAQWASAPRRTELGGALPRDISTDARASDNGVETSGKYSRTLENDHQLAAGWKLDHGIRRERQHTVDSSAPTLPKDDDFRGTHTVGALWVQDEWSLTPQWTTQAGVRWEWMDFRSRWIDADTAASMTSRSRNSVLSPLLHAVWRFDDTSKDQVRFSLTSSFKAPNSGQLIPKRSLAQNNTPTSPDRIGNPSLKPELSTGLDVAYEHYLSGNGLVSAGLFHRRIRNVIRYVTSDQPQTVPWSTVPRYVSRPVNISAAKTTGIELEAKLRLSDLVATLAPVDLRGNVSLFRSSVADVPGPDNRLDRQPNYTANLGADHRWHGTPLTTGASLNFTPAYAVQQSVVQRAEFGQKRVLDAYASWSFSPAAQLRLAASNLFPHALDNRSSYANPAVAYDETTHTVSQTATQWSLRLELRL